MSSQVLVSEQGVFTASQADEMGERSQVSERLHCLKIGDGLCFFQLFNFLLSAANAKLLSRRVFMNLRHVKHLSGRCRMTLYAAKCTLTLTLTLPHVPLLHAPLWPVSTPRACPERPRPGLTELMQIRDGDPHIKSA